MILGVSCQGKWRPITKNINILIFKTIDTQYPDYNIMTNECLMLELKSKHGKASQGQKKIARRLNVYEVRSFDRAVGLIRNFIT